MTADEKNWDYVIDYVRVFKHADLMTPDDWAARSPALKGCAGLGWGYAYQRQALGRLQMRSSE